MKKLLLILSLFLSLNTFSQSIIAPPETPSDELLLAYRALKCFIDDDELTVMLQPFIPLNKNMHGLTKQYHKNLYIISISDQIHNKVIRKWVLLHEIGHIIDFHNGTLTKFPLTWKGAPINPNLDWIDRPWEQSAEEWATIMWEVLEDNPPPVHVYKKIPSDTLKTK